MEKNTQLFMEYFGKIETELSRLTQKESSGPHTPFYEKVETASRKAAIVRRYKIELKTIGDLRNILSHNGNRNIAIPSDETIRLLKEIHEKLTNPPAAFEMSSKIVEKFDVGDTLEDVLLVIKKTKYSQFPVYDNKHFIGLLTENGITHWLAGKAKEGTVSFANTKIQELLVNDEKKKNYQFVNRNMDLYEIEEKFQDMYTEALFVTQNGKKQETILGIITGWDVLQQMER